MSRFFGFEVAVLVKLRQMSTRSTFVVIAVYVSADTECVCGGGIILIKSIAHLLFSKLRPLPDHDKNWAQSQSHYNTLKALISLGLPGTNLVAKNIL